MEKPYINTPEGTRDRLFHECRDRRACQGVLTTLFKSRGYSEVCTPEVEYYDLFLRSGDPLPQESMMKVIDRSGKICVMRPDCTTPIARVAATKLKRAPLPQRLYYNQTIFRSDEAHIGTESEIPQCGIELIGSPGLRGDAEAVAMAVDSLERCGLEQFHIELGHSDLFPALVRPLEADGETVATLRRLIERKNMAGLAALAGTLGHRPGFSAIRRLPTLFGGDAVLREAEELAGGGEAGRVIAYLRELYAVLCASGRGHRIRFDLGRVTKLEYYTGVVFSGYAQGAGRQVLLGGRYDNLLGCFGREAPATGFAVYVDDLAACLPPTELPVLDTVIHFEPAAFGEAMALLDTLPNGTAALSPREGEAESIDLAREKGARRVLVVTGAENREIPL